MNAVKGQTFPGDLFHRQAGDNHNRFNVRLFGREQRQQSLQQQQLAVTGRIKDNTAALDGGTFNES
jgi:hypothetical protein